MRRLGQIFRRLLRIVGIPLAVFLGVLLVPLIWIGAVCGPFQDVHAEPVAALPEPVQAAKTDLNLNSRAESQTYLTLPEWYIVYSAEEYANFIQEQSSSAFPYFAAIGQYWRSYNNVCTLTRGKYAFNPQYHGMLYIIGVSFSFEYLAKGIYEKSFGQITQWAGSPEITEEEVFAQGVAQEYGAFLYAIPWFEFPYGARLRELWTQTSWWGADPLRKWERKLALSLEYGGKAAYASLIKAGNDAAFEWDDQDILVIVADLPEDLLEDMPDAHRVTAIDDEYTIIAIPRYEVFNRTMPALAAAGVRFVEIAGNDEIMLTAWAPRSWDYDLAAGELLFSLPILTDPELKRIAVNVPVQSLHTILRDLASQDIRLEHLYDY